MCDGATVRACDCLLAALWHQFLTGAEQVGNRSHKLSGRATYVLLMK